MGETAVRDSIDLDEDEHVALASLVAGSFTPTAVAAIRPRIAAAAELLGWTLKSGDDFVATFARELPALSLSALFDIPIDDHRQVFAWVDESREDPDAELALERYAHQLIRRRRKAPGNDALSKLLLDRERPSDDGTLAIIVRTLLVAWNDTTRCTLGLAMLTLAACPDVWERIADEPDSIDAVVEEVLRLATLDHSGVDATVTREVLHTSLLTLTRQLTRLAIVGEPTNHVVAGIDGPSTLRLGFERRVDRELFGPLITR